MFYLSDVYFTGLYTLLPLVTYWTVASFLTFFKYDDFTPQVKNQLVGGAARVQTIDDDNKVDGEYYQVDDVLFDPTGKRTEKVVFAPVSTLQRVQISPSDLQEIQRSDPFVLTAEEIGQYNVKYVGRQKVDEEDFYVFDVSPKVIDADQIHEAAGRVKAVKDSRNRLIPPTPL